MHRLTNRSVWGIDVAPWALTIMNGGGEVIVPHEPYRSHDDYLLPARPLLPTPNWSPTRTSQLIFLRSSSCWKIFSSLSASACWPVRW